MTSPARIRKGSPPFKAPELGRVLARIAEEIRLAVCAVDGALRAELDTIEASLANLRKTQPLVQLPKVPYCCKDPHIRIRHDHGMLCIQAPRLAGKLSQLAQELLLPDAPDLTIPAFDLRPFPKAARPIIDARASCAAIVREARKRGYTPFEDGSADVMSVTCALTGSPCPFGITLLSLSKIVETPARRAVRDLADTLFFSGSRLHWIAARIADCGNVAGLAQAVAECLRELQPSLQLLDAQIRDVCLLDPTPRGRHSRDIVFQEVVCALTNEGFGDAEIARLIVPTKARKLNVWRKRIAAHLDTAANRGFGIPPVNRFAMSFSLGFPSHLETLQRLN
ncbi:MAG: hypothetical protein ABW061_24125 [Polyangiaceae bacterium]